MTWTNVQVTAGDPTKASDLNSVQANFEAMANGDAGAPEIKPGAGERLPYPPGTNAT